MFVLSRKISCGAYLQSAAPPRSTRRGVRYMSQSFYYVQILQYFEMLSMMKYWRSIRINRVQSGWKVSDVLRARVNEANLVSELVAVVHVRVVVFGHHDPVGELASGESLHGFLTLCGGNVLHEDLQGET